MSALTAKDVKQWVDHTVGQAGMLEAKVSMAASLLKTCAEDPTVNEIRLRKIMLTVAEKLAGGTDG